MDGYMYLIYCSLLTGVSGDRDSALIEKPLELRLGTVLADDRECSIEPLIAVLPPIMFARILEGVRWVAILLLLEKLLDGRWVRMLPWLFESKEEILWVVVKSAVPLPLLVLALGALLQVEAKAFFAFLLGEFSLPCVPLQRRLSEPMPLSNRYDCKSKIFNKKYG